MTGTRRGWVVLQLSVSIVLLAGILLWGDLLGALQSITPLSPAWLAALAVNAWLQIALQAARWGLFTQAAGLELSFKERFKASALASLTNQFLPSSLPGEAVRYRWAQGRTGTTASAPVVQGLFADRVSGLMGLAFMGIVSLYWAWGALAPAHDYLRIAAYLAAASLAIWSVAARFVELKWARGILEQTLFHPGARSHLAISATYSFSISAGYWLSLKALGHSPAFAPTAMLFIAVQAVLALPISFSGWGVRELTAAALLGPAVGGERAATAASVLFGIAHLAAILPAVFFLAGSPLFLKRKPLAQSQEPT